MSFFSSLTSLETEARKMNFFFITLSFEIELLNREDGFRLLFAQRVTHLAPEKMYLG